MSPAPPKELPLQALMVLGFAKDAIPEVWHYMYYFCLQVQLLLFTCLTCQTAPAFSVYFINTQGEGLGDCPYHYVPSF